MKEQNLTPLARLVSYFTSGVEPSIMGIGPVPAIKGALSRAEKTLDDMDLIEVRKQGQTDLFRLLEISLSFSLDQ